MARFHALRVAAVDRLTDDSVALTFDVPPDLRVSYRHAPGQHLALRRVLDGTEVRRTYSICSPAPGPEGPRTLRVGVRLVDGGAFSTYALKDLTVGEEVDVMLPAGRFTLDPAPGRYAAVVGGSGITPSCRSRGRCWSASPRPGSVCCAVTGRRRRPCSWRRWPTSRTASPTASSW